MWFNPIMKWLITSPLHPFVSNNMLLITYKGRKSGNIYTTPVNYIRDGSTLYVTSWRERTWWRNLREGDPVSLRLKGRDHQAVPQVIEDDDEVAGALLTCFRLAPRLAKYYQVAIDETGNPSVADTQATAKSKVVVRLKIDPETG